VRGKEFKLWCGGKGANQAVMASKLGGSVKMCGMVGEDIFGEANIKSMQENGVNTDLITKTRKCATATGCVTVTEDGENCIVVTLGANLELQPSRVDEIEYEISKAHIILLQSEIPQETNLKAFEVAKKHGGKNCIV
jgi:ribokinase